MPKLQCTPNAPKLRLPKIAWRNASIRGELPARLTEKLTMLLATQATHEHLYPPNNARPPPSRAEVQQLTQNGDLYIEMFQDGLYDPPVDRGDQPAAGWSFIVVAYLPIDIGHGCHAFTGGYLVFARWGPVIEAPTDAHYLGAKKQSNNTVEL